MPRTFAYVRVSTAGQTTENQIQEIEAAGQQFTKVCISVMASRSPNRRQ
jgi:DNA invertase Pin-like site-specific DNA recombinase